ncbi:MAG: DUF4339 domain-containing protein, partial [Verrucomicrobiota bacterium]
MSEWYYEGDHNTQEGPFPEDAILTALENGKIQRKTLVWQDGMEEWTALDNSSLFSRVAVCTQSGRLARKSEMLAYGQRYILPEYSDAFTQS